MTVEYRFVLADFRCIGPGGAPRLYEAGRSYPMPPAFAHAAAKRGLVAKAKPRAWVSPGFGRRAEVRTEADVTGAGAELEALERHAQDTLSAAPDA